MPLTSTIVNNKITKRKLIIILEENDNILQNIEKAMRDNFVSKASVFSITGKIKSGKINFFRGNSYRNEVIENFEIIKGAGYFELSKKTGLFGNIKLVLLIDGKKDSYTLASGIAKEMVIEMEYFDLI